jgi:hypothetical protein
MFRTDLHNVLTSHSANCDNFYQFLETSHGTIDGDDLEFFDGASLEPMESSSEVAFAGPRKQSLRDTGDEALSSRLKLQVHPGELQHFVHMLLMESALSSSLSPSSIIAESTKSHSATEYLDSLTESHVDQLVNVVGTSEASCTDPNGSAPNSLTSYFSSTDIVVENEEHEWGESSGLTIRPGHHPRTDQTGQSDRSRHCFNRDTQRQMPGDASMTGYQMDVHKPEQTAPFRDEPRRDERLV